MSDRMSYDAAYAKAHSCLSWLAPFCEDIVIAGSLRRHEPTIGDIEIVARPKMLPPALDLFGVTVGAPPPVLYGELELALMDGRLTHPEHKGWGERMRKFMYHGAKVDLFICPEAERFGTILLIRTGSAEFSHAFAAHLQRSGIWRFAGGALERRQVYGGAEPTWIPVATLTEADVFRLAGVPFIEPQDRGANGPWREAL